MKGQGSLIIMLSVLNALNQLTNFFVESRQESGVTPVLICTHISCIITWLNSEQLSHLILQTVIN